MKNSNNLKIKTKWQTFSYLFLCCFAGMAVISSCAPTRRYSGDPVDVQVGQSLKKGWLQVAEDIQSIQGLAQVHVQAPLSSMTGQQVLLVNKPDKIRSETLSPFGIPIMTFTANSGQLNVLLPSQNTYYRGAASPENLSLFAQIPLDIPSLIEILLYQPPLIDAWQEKTYRLDNEGWILIRYGTLRRQELVFNNSRRLVEVAFFDDNALKIRIRYKHFVESSDQYPRKLILELPEKHAKIELDFSSVKVNAPFKQGVFNLIPPQGANVVYLPVE
jgi:outer membrane lipoprotein-sorting protein